MRKSLLDQEEMMMLSFHHEIVNSHCGADLFHKTHSSCDVDESMRRICMVHRMQHILMSVSVSRCEENVCENEKK